MVERTGGEKVGMTSVTAWTPEDLATLDRRGTEIPVIAAADVVPVLPGQDIWDVWPLQDEDGSVAQIGGGEIWICLAAETRFDPELRHDVARTRFLFRQGAVWTDCGNLFPDDLNPGSREWSGSAMLLDDRRTIIAYFTATGRRGEAEKSFEQRLFQARGTLAWDGARPVARDWTEARPLCDADGVQYRDLTQVQMVNGKLKGFRDPGFFVDPADKRVHLFFAGSMGQSAEDLDGVIGRAEAGGPEGPFLLAAPVVVAEGVAGELERPHMIVHDGRYYLFWSCHAHVLRPVPADAPTGLYGMVGDTPAGPFAPLNGSGLVLSNPAAEPTQGYCWQVLDTLEVVSFVNYWGLAGRSVEDPAVKRAQFGGTFAPRLRIALDGATTTLVSPDR